MNIELTNLNNISKPVPTKFLVHLAINCGTTKKRVMENFRMLYFASMYVFYNQAVFKVKHLPVYVCMFSALPPEWTM